MKEKEMKMGFFERRVARWKKRMRGFNAKPDWWYGGLGVRGRNMDWLNNDRFQKAWKFSEKGNVEGWKKVGHVPQITWRAHICCWAASNALKLEGDLVECGVHTGLLSMTVCDYLEFEKYPEKKFYLFDTYNGIPEEGLTGEGKIMAENYNKGIFYDVYDLAKENFSRYSNVELVRGVLPQSLDSVKIDKISYLSIDLNIAKYEKEVIEALWDKLVTGAMVVLDDYAFMGHVRQYEMWNEFAESKGKVIATIPTGQGLLQK